MPVERIHCLVPVKDYETWKSANVDSARIFLTADDVTLKGLLSAVTPADIVPCLSQGKLVDITMDIPATTLEAISMKSQELNCSIDDLKLYIFRNLKL